MINLYLMLLGEYEAYYAVTPKGPSGMNSDRAYSLDKRSYDPSMLNVLSASTGFAGNVGNHKTGYYRCKCGGNKRLYL